MESLRGRDNNYYGGLDVIYVNRFILLM